MSRYKVGRRAVVFDKVRHEPGETFDTGDPVADHLVETGALRRVRPESVPEPAQDAHGENLVPSDSQEA